MSEESKSGRLSGRAADGSQEFPYALSVRLSARQRAYLATIAEVQQIATSAALRVVLDQAIERDAPHLKIAAKVLAASAAGIAADPETAERARLRQELVDDDTDLHDRRLKPGG
jgi:hypothetical protein